MKNKKERFNLKPVVVRKEITDIEQDMDKTIIDPKDAPASGGMNGWEAILASLYYTGNQEAIKISDYSEKEYIGAVAPCGNPIFERSMRICLPSVDVSQYHPKAIDFEPCIVAGNASGLSTYITTTDEDKCSGSGGLLVDPVIVGNADRALGVFIPFGADIATFDFVSSMFSDIRDADWKNNPFAPYKDLLPKKEEE